MYIINCEDLDRLMSYGQCLELLLFSSRVSSPPVNLSLVSINPLKAMGIRNVEIVLSNGWTSIS